MTANAVKLEHAFEAASSTDKTAEITRWVALLIPVFLPALALAAGLRNAGVGWDDGAITAAFARTFAHTGRIALTPSSEQVEGFSSLSWFFILATFYKFIHSFTAMLAVTKILSAACFSAALFSFRRVANRALEPRYAAFAILLMGFAVTPFNEVVNGMEMNFAMLLTLLLVEILYWPKTGRIAEFCAAAVLSGLLLTTRFEAPFLLLFLYVGAWQARGDARLLVSLSAVNAIEFGAIDLWRHRVFGLWVPNTIMAKRWAPYTHHTTSDLLGSRYAATLEILTVLMVPILLLAALMLAEWVAAGVNRPPKFDWPVSSPTIPLTVGSLLLGLLLGQNWGHPGRMILPFLPFVVLTIVAFYRAFAIANPHGLRLLLPIVVVCHAFAWLPLAANAAHENATSVRKILRVGQAVEGLRTMLGRDTLTAFIPDVGASALCCDKLRILDGGLLTSRYLAEHGPGSTAQFLAENRPDVIETHSPWDRVEDVYTPLLAHEYSPARVNGVFLLLRNDLYQKVVASGVSERRLWGISGLCGGPPPAQPDEFRYIANLEHCVELPEKYAGNR